MSRDLFTRAFRVGIAGPVGSGKTALIAAVARRLASQYSIGVITNDVYTKEDAYFLISEGVLPPERILGLETGDYPHTAIREDISMNVEAVGELEARNPGLEVVFLESGGDNLAAAFSSELADIAIYVLDAAAGDRSPRKGGPGMVRSDLLIINRIDLARHVGATPAAIEYEARRVRGERPVLFTNLKSGEGVGAVVAWLEELLTARFGPIEGSRSRDVSNIVPPELAEDWRI